MYFSKIYLMIEQLRVVNSLKMSLMMIEFESVVDEERLFILLANLPHEASLSRF